MSSKPTPIIDAVKKSMGDKVVASSNFRGDQEVIVAPGDWKVVATFLRDDEACKMDHFIDLTVVDWPEREPELPRYDVVLHMRSMSNNQRIRVRTRVAEKVDSLVDVWPGAGWAEREAFDMFGVIFDGHGDLRRILMYEQFVGHPLRKDYDIAHAQPLVPYRDVPGLAKLAPFGADMGQPWGRVDWSQRLEGNDSPVSPSIAEQSEKSRDLVAPSEGEG